MMKANQQKLFNLLGLAQRAGKVASGETAVENMIRSGKAKLVLVAGDAAAAAKKSYGDMAAFYNVKVFEISDKITLGNCIGKNARVAVALSDAGFVEAMVKLLREE